MQPLFDTTAPKKATNLTINSDLLATARRLKINLSATLESALTAKLNEQKRRNWKDENKQSIEGYNAFITKGGVFSDGLRQF